MSLSLSECKFRWPILAYRLAILTPTPCRIEGEPRYSSATIRRVCRAAILTCDAAGSPGLAKAVLDFATGDEQILAAHREALLSLFTDRVLGSREPLPPSTISAYRALAAAITESELSKRLLPTVVRLSKRSPETVLNSTAAVFGMLRLDLSQHAEGLVRELLPLLRHARETVRCVNTARRILPLVLRYFLSLSC